MQMRPSREIGRARFAQLAGAPVSTQKNDDESEKNGARNAW
jgi:hypothetical protein